MADFHFLDEEERKHAVLTNYNDKSVYYNEWIEQHKEMYNYVVKKLSEIKPSDFTF